MLPVACRPAPHTQWQKRNRERSRAHFPSCCNATPSSRCEGNHQVAPLRSRGAACKALPPKPLTCTCAMSGVTKAHGRFKPEPRRLRTRYGNGIRVKTRRAAVDKGVKSHTKVHGRFKPEPRRLRTRYGNGRGVETRRAALVTGASEAHLRLRPRLP